MKLKILKIHLHNFKKYFMQPDYEIEFKSENEIADLILINGKNGEGKTTIADAIFLAFTKKTYENRSFELNQLSNENIVISVDFSLDDKIHNITRTISKNERNNNVWTTTIDNKTIPDKKVNDTLKMIGFDAIDDFYVSVHPLSLINPENNTKDNAMALFYKLMINSAKKELVETIQSLLSDAEFEDTKLFSENEIIAYCDNPMLVLNDIKELNNDNKSVGAMLKAKQTTYESFKNNTKMLKIDEVKALENRLSNAKDSLKKLQKQANELNNLVDLKENLTKKITAINNQLKEINVIDLQEELKKKNIELQQKYEKQGNSYKEELETKQKNLNEIIAKKEEINALIEKDKKALDEKQTALKQANEEKIKVLQDEFKKQDEAIVLQIKNLKENISSLPQLDVNQALKSILDDKQKTLNEKLNVIKDSFKTIKELKDLKDFYMSFINEITNLQDLLNSDITIRAFQNLLSNKDKKEELNNQLQQLILSQKNLQQTYKAKQLEISSTSTEISTLQKQWEENIKQITTIQKQIDSLNSQINEVSYKLKSLQQDFNKEWETFKTKITNDNQQVENLKLSLKNQQNELKEITTKINNITNQQEINLYLSTLKNRINEIETSIADYQKQLLSDESNRNILSTLQNEYENLLSQNKQALINQAKIEYLKDTKIQCLNTITDFVNERCKRIKISLYENINGVETEKFLIKSKQKDVSYYQMNNAEQWLCGYELANLFQTFNNVALPIIIDGVESIDVNQRAELIRDFFKNENGFKHQLFLLNVSANNLKVLNFSQTELKEIL